MTKKAAQTGVGPTVTVAIEQFFPDTQRLINDDLAYSILPWGMRALVWVMRFAPARNWFVSVTEKSVPGIWAGLMCRKRYIDEKLVAAAYEIEAVVNLGAGFDTRLYRLPTVAQLPAWEVDQSENIQPKRLGLQKVFGQIPNRVKLVSIDFDHEASETVLASHGYSLDQRTFFVWEAVSQYLTESGIKTTFAFLAKAAPGSRLAFTYIRKDFLDGDDFYNQERLYQQYVIKDKAWLYGWNPEEVADFLAQYGWRVIEHLGYDELAEKYVKPTGRASASMPIERIVYAEKF